MIQDHCTNTRRNDINLTCSPYRTTLFKNSLFFFDHQVWNTLKNSYKDYDNMPITSFKYKLKKYLLQQQAK